MSRQTIRALTFGNSSLPLDMVFLSEKMWVVVGVGSAYAVEHFLHGQRLGLAVILQGVDIRAVEGVGVLVAPGY